MQPYPSIKTVFDRDPENKYRTLLDNQWALPEFEYLRDNAWMFTEKIDGTNIRVGWESCGPDATTPLLRFGGRTDNAQMPTFLFARLSELFTADKLAACFPDGGEFTLYGEGFGARIQKSGGNYIPDGVDFILFDVLCQGVWLSRPNVEDIAEKLGIRIVPVVGYGTLSDAVEFTREGFNSVFGAFPAEGLVLRPTLELKNRQGHRIISKVKTKDFIKQVTNVDH